MEVRNAKSKASKAVKDIIAAARRYIEAEQQLKEAIEAETPKKQKSHESANHK